jgi:hypothetical protein
MILKTLVEYEISLSQVYTITTDIGSNMLLAVKLFSEERRSSTNNDGNIEECFIKEFPCLTRLYLMQKIFRFCRGRRRWHSSLV